MRPAYQQRCEICGKLPLILFDGRIRFCSFGPKGHWLFLCPVCHYLWGIGYREDDLTVYERMAGHYHEVNGGIFRMKEPDIREAVRAMIKENGPEAWQMLLIGEISVQLAAINGTLEKMVGYLAAIEAHMQPVKPSKHLQLEVVDGNRDSD